MLHDSGGIGMTVRLPDGTVKNGFDILETPLEKHLKKGDNMLQPGTGEIFGRDRFLRKESNAFPLEKTESMIS